MMLNLDERLAYLEKLEAAQVALLADPEIAAEYDRASQAWNAAIGTASLDARSVRDSPAHRSAGPR